MAEKNLPRDPEQQPRKPWPSFKPNPALALTPTEFTALDNAWVALEALGVICEHTEPCGMKELLGFISTPLSEIADRLRKAAEEGGDE